jgi:hypothetical protein
MPRSSTRPQTETVYMRPDMDTLYLPNLFTLDANVFVANKDTLKGRLEGWG